MPASIAWYRRLDVRLAAMLLIALLAFDAFGRPLFEAALGTVGIEVSQGMRHLLWLSAVTAIAVAVSVFVSRRLTRRLVDLAYVAGRPLPCGRLPGPFDDSGGDEVAALAATMNGMRARVNQLVDDIAQHEVHRQEWLAQVSHDLRTPLTALVACLDRAELALQSPRPETLYQEVPDLLAVAKLDVDRVESLTSDLFEIARLEARDALNLEPVPPGELVRQAVKGLEPLAAKKGVRLVVQLASQLPILSADGRRLMRALENLLRNAIQHAEAYVWVRVEPTEDGMRFEVRDDGPGFPEHDGELSLEELRSRRSREDSAGLGLLVTQRVAEAHEGTVGAYNSRSGGAVVWFALPLRAEEESPEDDADEPQDSTEVGLAS